MAKIMVVDDAPVMIRNVELILRQAGHEVVAEACDGFEALKYYERYKPDLVTMDLEMPQMDGLNAIKAIIERDAAAKIVVISGAAQKNNIIKAIRLGASHFIVKPISMEKVVEVIDTVLKVSLSPNKKQEMADKLEQAMGGGGMPNHHPFHIQNRDNRYIAVTLTAPPGNEELCYLERAVRTLLRDGHKNFLWEFTEPVNFAELPIQQISEMVALITGNGGQVRAMCFTNDFWQAAQQSTCTAGAALNKVLKMAQRG